MRMNVLWDISVLAVLMLVGVSGMAQAETQLKQLGRNPFYETELTSIDEVRQMVAATLPDLKQGFAKAGAANLFDDFVAQAGRAENITQIEVNPGETLRWMILKKGKTVKIVKDVVWVGKDPFSAFLLNVDKAGTRYTFVVPAKYGNVSLALTSPQPAVEQQPVPNLAPHCQAVVTPLTLPSGMDITIDASQSVDPDGSISLVLIQATDAGNTVVKKKIDKPPFIHRMTLVEPGDYTIQVSVTDNKNQESSAPKCEATIVTVASAKTAVIADPGNGAKL